MISNLNKLVGLILVIVLLLTAFSLAGCQKQDDTGITSVDFTAAPVVGSAPLTVQFTAQFTSRVTNWWWFFGDGEVSQEQNPSHTYTDDGIYTVSLVAIGRGEPQTMTKDDYIHAGTAVPPWRLRLFEAGMWDVDMPPHDRIVLLDLAGEGVLYWTAFTVKDKDESSWKITEQYEHSIYIDQKECYGELDQIVEIWYFQGGKVMRPSAYYPTIYAKGENAACAAFWRVNIPFHHSLTFFPENNDDWGTIEAHRSSVFYGLVTSGVPGKGPPEFKTPPEKWQPLGEQWAGSIRLLREKIGFPAAPKIKSALEERSGKKVFSVQIFYQQIQGTGKFVDWLFVDAPDIGRDEIGRLLNELGLVEPVTR